MNYWNVSVKLGQVNAEHIRRSQMYLNNVAMITIKIGIIN